MMSDTHSIEAIVHALYDVISGPVGALRDWDRFRSLFFPGARLVRTSIGPDGRPRAQAMDVRAYEADTADYFCREPFYEIEVARRIERFGNIAQGFSVYEARHAPGDAHPFRRGINSIQLFHDGQRWWVVSVLWDNERDDNPIPLEYLSMTPGGRAGRRGET
jgi:hypothetical protein